MKSHFKINFWTLQLSITHKKQLYAVFLFMNIRKLNLPISSIGHVWCWKLFRMRLNHPQIYTQTLQWKYKPSIKRCGKWNKKTASQFFKFKFKINFTFCMSKNSGHLLSDKGESRGVYSGKSDCLVLPKTGKKLQVFGLKPMKEQS